MNSMNKNQTRSSLPDLSLMNSNIFQATCEITKIRKPQFFLRITSKNKKNIYKKHLQKLTTAICLLVKGGGLCKPVLNELRS